MVKSLDEVIERLQYKADNIKAKLEPSYFTECIEYLKTLPREENEDYAQRLINKVAKVIVEAFDNLSIEDVNMYKLGYNKAIDEFVNALKNSSNMHKWSCGDMTLEFCNGDDCDECENEFMKEIYEIAEQMKGE